MSDAFRVVRPFERYDEKLKAPRKYARGSIISPKDAIQIKSLPTLEAAGNIYRLPEELARELAKRPDDNAEIKEVA